MTEKKQNIAYFGTFSRRLAFLCQECLIQGKDCSKKKYLEALISHQSVGRFVQSICTNESKLIVVTKTNLDIFYNFFFFVLKIAS